MTPLTDFRALCAELVDALDEYDSANPFHDCAPLIARARAALSAAPQQPSDEIADRLYGFAMKYLNTWGGRYSYANYKQDVHKLLTRYGGQAEPVPVAWNEDPGDEGCDSEGRRWCFSPHQGNGHQAGWSFRRLQQNVYDTHWLPHWALPLPEAQP